MSTTRKSASIDDALRRQRKTVGNIKLALGDARSSIRIHVERCEALDLTKLDHMNEQLRICGAFLSELVDRQSAAADLKDLRDLAKMVAMAADEVAGRYQDLARSEVGLLDHSPNVNATIRLLRKVHKATFDLIHEIERPAAASAK